MQNRFKHKVALPSTNRERPTRDRIRAIEKECEQNFKIDYCVKWKCNKCRVSDKYKKLVGIRLEELPVKKIGR